MLVPSLMKQQTLTSSTLWVSVISGPSPPVTCTIEVTCPWILWPPNWLGWRRYRLGHTECRLQRESLLLGEKILL
jgi:hypothetical protein